jgi:dTDP-4-dehydrorhamnose reductase
MGRTALIGANGQLGSDIVRLWPASGPGRRGEQLIALTHADIEVTDRNQARSVLEGVRPDLVINTAAFHRVDDCEADPGPAFAVNALAVMRLAEACRDLGATLMHFSTDYVFDGRKGEPYREDDAVRPVSAYGISKAAGEHFLRYILPDAHVIVRSSGLYGVAGASGKGGNFVETMLRLAREGGPLRVVDDQVSAPTFTLDLAEKLLELAAAGGRGTFHITNRGECSWFEFAAEIFADCGLKPDLAAITSEEYAAPARRPAYSVLENACLSQLGLEQPRPWQEALLQYLQLKGRVPL